MKRFEAMNERRFNMKKKLYEAKMESNKLKEQSFRIDPFENNCSFINGLD